MSHPSFSIAQTRKLLQVSVTANAPCAQVMAEMKARVDGQSTGSEDAEGTVGRKGPPEKGWVSGFSSIYHPHFPCMIGDILYITGLITHFTKWGEPPSRGTPPPHEPQFFTRQGVQMMGDDGLSSP